MYIHTIGIYTHKCAPVKCFCLVWPPTAAPISKSLAECDSVGCYCAIFLDIKVICGGFHLYLPTKREMLSGDFFYQQATPLSGGLYLVNNICCFIVSLGHVSTPYQFHTNRHWLLLKVTCQSHLVNTVDFQLWMYFNVVMQAVHSEVAQVFCLKALWWQPRMSPYSSLST